MLISILQLARLNKPVGIYLLLWPTLTAVALSGLEMGGISPQILILFAIGTVVARSAGCVINDVLDRNIDPHVERTSERPIASGRLSVKTALVVFAVLGFIALLICWQFNVLTRWMALGGIVITMIYPLAKRITRSPQVVLGIAFSWGILMASTAISEQIFPAIWVLFAVNFVWIIAYDTIYAIMDLPDDQKIGIGSTAVLLDERSWILIAVCYLITWSLLIYLGIVVRIGLIYYAFLIPVAFHFVKYVEIVRRQQKDDYQSAFNENATDLLLVFCGIVVAHLTSL